MKAEQKQAIVAAFLEGMYYAGRLPSRSEITAIAMWLVKYQLAGDKRLSVEQVVSEQMDALHQRLGYKKPDAPPEEQLLMAMRAAVAEVPPYAERYVCKCHLCGETNKTLLQPCQGCKKLVCPRCSLLHPAVALTVCDTCVESVRQAVTE